MWTSARRRFAGLVACCTLLLVILPVAGLAQEKAPGKRGVQADTLTGASAYWNHPAKWAALGR